MANEPPPIDNLLTKLYKYMQEVVWKYAIA